MNKSNEKNHVKNYISLKKNTRERNIILIIKKTNSLKNKNSGVKIHQMIITQKIKKKQV